MSRRGWQSRHDPLTRGRHGRTRDRGPESWTLRVYGPGEKVSLSELGIELSVDAIYEDARDQLPEEPGLLRA